MACAQAAAVFAPSRGLSARRGVVVFGEEDLGAPSHPTWRRRRRVRARARARAGRPGDGEGEQREDREVEATTQSIIASGDPRKERLALLQQSYNQRRTPPPLPPGYRVVVQEPTLTGSTKYRIVVVAPSQAALISSGDDAGPAEREHQRANREKEKQEREGDGEVVGWVVVWRRNGKGGSRTLFLSSVEVKKDFRRRGIASRLLHEAERFATQRGCAEAALTVVKTNAPAIALYTRQGYAIDDGGGSSAAERIAEVFTDPQRILQHRMRKSLTV